MKFFDYIRMALGNLWRRKLRSFLTIIAVVIGAVAVLTLTTLVVTASSVFMKQLDAMGILTQVTVTPSNVEVQGPFGGGFMGDGEEGIKLDDTIIEKIEKIPHVVAVSGQTYVRGFKSVRLEGTEKKFSAQLQANHANKASDGTMVAGRNFLQGEKNKVIIGQWYAKKFGFEEKNIANIIGKKVIFTTEEGFSGYGVDLAQPPQEGNNKEWWEEQNKKTYDIEAEIVGVLMSGPGTDGPEIYITMDWAHDIMIRRWWEADGEAGKEQEKKGIYEPWPMIIVTEDELDKRGYGMLIVRADSTQTVVGVASDIEKLENLGLGTITPQDMLDELQKIFTVLGVILTAIGGISLAVASLGIINTMVMATYERTREIGVMRACGARRSTIRNLFTMEASLIGFLGGMIGVGILFGMVKIGNIYGNQFLEEQNIPLQNIIDPPLWLTLGVIGFTTIIGTIAGLYPAFRAARLNPVDALRHE
ncbi:MAG: hypothetical protein A3B74_04565 [Candidatus Kerfeldbacteria bacterium RIFCSPHIGHO2_02_FULL_42_14]|uniref:ABC3 transporter permease protein domain-containing protein n=1 Tax=Candidatus Kerfeldbacteria bacterium RIFCSPHIGHO2_02_FULL_42_14 TaxID=1798540 RepID=A0A1G2ANY9_9BACT|nr:MAG: hypothetical protein A3B74_04565 [Candidatus Kerfeldbacteria bacterium RIFCSPHIGHO2_02_FULL_42_14]OGY82141.1 MAG: hypothetical protein A3E60_00255 [Candidatus Kerfeldbacteria bacterium RIFCSPHIGHO2_12_FULL_42_13]OGY84966.1 MAG: hypothetical protein A3I91_00590 [Candidatus Kerfeldbacteria bacterium RIFCSPLOWO2_02_FULL_42_19]